MDYCIKTRVIWPHIQYVSGKAGPQATKEGSRWQRPKRGEAAETVTKRDSRERPKEASIPSTSQSPASPPDNSHSCHKLPFL